MTMMFIVNMNLFEKKKIYIDMNKTYSYNLWNTSLKILGWLKFKFYVMGNCLASLRFWNLEKDSGIHSYFNKNFKKKSYQIQIGEFGNVYENLNDMKANDTMMK